MRLLPLLVSSLLMSAAVAQDLVADAQIEVRNRLRVPEFGNALLLALAAAVLRP